MEPIVGTLWKLNKNHLKATELSRIPLFKKEKKRKEKQPLKLAEGVTFTLSGLVYKSAMILAIKSANNKGQIAFVNINFNVLIQVHQTYKSNSHTSNNCESHQ